MRSIAVRMRHLHFLALSPRGVVFRGERWPERSEGQRGEASDLSRINGVVHPSRLAAGSNNACAFAPLCFVASLLASLPRSRETSRALSSERFGNTHPDGVASGINLPAWLNTANQLKWLLN